MQPKRLIVCPTYNEKENIGELLDVLMALEPRVEVLVVDDSSPDGTGKIVTTRARSEDRIHLLTRAKKDGLAAAYLSGFEWALARGYDRILQMDADFSHPPSDVPKMFALLDDSDLVIGCRYIAGGGTSGWGWTRSIISRGGNTYAQALLGLPYGDLTGGFNAWRADALKGIGLTTMRSRGYAFQVELKFRAHRAGQRVAELPIHFENRKHGRSKMSGWIVWEAAFRVLEMRRGEAP